MALSASASRWALPLLLLANALLSGMLVDRTLRLRDGWAVYRMRVQAAEALRRLPPAPGGPGAAPERAGR